jgi:hypothetical protein
MESDSYLGRDTDYLEIQEPIDVSEEHNASIFLVEE